MKAPICLSRDNTETREESYLGRQKSCKDLDQALRQVLKSREAEVQNRSQNLHQAPAASSAAETAPGRAWPSAASADCSSNTSRSGTGRAARQNLRHSLNPAAMKLPLQTDTDCRITKPGMLLARSPKEFGSKRWRCDNQCPTSSPFLKSIFL